VENSPDPHRQDHRAALVEIAKLWGASSGSPDGDKLDTLVALVETYEERRWPVRTHRIAGLPFAVRSQHAAFTSRAVTGLRRYPPLAIFRPAAAWAFV
jgi:hypothetical protein